MLTGVVANCLVCIYLIIAYCLSVVPLPSWAAHHLLSALNIALSFSNRQLCTFFLKSVQKYEKSRKTGITTRAATVKSSYQHPLCTSQCLQLFTVDLKISPRWKMSQQFISYLQYRFQLPPQVSLQWRPVFLSHQFPNKDYLNYGKIQLKPSCTNITNKTVLTYFKVKLVIKCNFGAAVFGVCLGPM